MVYTIHGMVYITCISWYISCYIAWYITFILMSEHVPPWLSQRLTAWHRKARCQCLSNCNATWRLFDGRWVLKFLCDAIYGIYHGIYQHGISQFYVVYHTSIWPGIYHSISHLLVTESWYITYVISYMRYITWYIPWYIGISFTMIYWYITWYIS